MLYRDQLEYLKHNHCNLTLICGGSEHALSKLRERKVGKVINYKLARNPNVIQDFLALIRLIWHFLFNRYDLVVFTTPKALLLGSISSFITAQSRRVAFFQGRVYENFTGIKRKFFSLLDRITIFCSHECIFVSKSLMDEFIKEMPAVKNKGKVIGNGSGNGINTDRFSPKLYLDEELVKLRSYLGIKDNDFIVLTVGRICLDKGLKEIIEIADIVSKKESSIRFVMVGRVEDQESFQSCSELISKGIIIHVDFVDDIAPYYLLADIHLFLSHREGFGNVAIEAAAMGVPTLAFDVVGIKDSVSEGISGLRFKFGDSKVVADTILKFFSEPTELKNQFSNSREWAITNFSNHNVWNNYKKFYLNQ